MITNLDIAIATLEIMGGAMIFIILINLVAYAIADLIMR